MGIMNLVGVPAAASVHTVALSATRGLAMWQADSINSGNSKLLMMFVGIAAAALLAQAIAFVIMAVVVTKAQKRGIEIFEELRVKALPLMVKSDGLIEELGPKIKDITNNLHHISNVVKDKVVELEPTISAANVTAKEANARTQAQMRRVDGMVTSFLNATAEIAGTVHQSIRTPVREVAGVVSGVKAGIDTLVGRLQNLKSNVAAARAVRVTQVPSMASRVHPTGATPASARVAAREAQLAADKRDLNL
jgi:hypothetical protein